MNDSRVPPDHRRLRRIWSDAEICARIDELVDELYRTYVNRDLCLVVIAEGARRFADELVFGLEERLVLPSVRFVRAWRTQGTELCGVQVEHIDPSEFEELDVLIVDDIADEGRTLEAVMELVREGEPRTLEAAVLVNKTARRNCNLPIRYVGFEIARGWVVGFGMDLDGQHRDLDYIAVIENTE